MKKEKKTKHRKKAAAQPRLRYTRQEIHLDREELMSLPREQGNALLARAVLEAIKRGTFIVIS